MSPITITQSGGNDKKNLHYTYDDGVYIYLNYEGTGELQSVYLEAGRKDTGRECLFVTRTGFGRTSVEKVFNASSEGTACGSSNHRLSRSDTWARNSDTVCRRNQIGPGHENYVFKSGGTTTFLEPGKTGYVKNTDGQREELESGSPISDAEFKSMQLEMPPPTALRESVSPVFDDFEDGDDASKKTTFDFIVLTRIAALALFKRNALEPIRLVPSVIIGYDVDRVYRNDDTCFHFIANGGNLDHIYIHDDKKDENIFLKTDGSGFIRNGEAFKSFNGHENALRSLSQHIDLQLHECPENSIRTRPHHELFAKTVIHALKTSIE